MKGVTRVCGSQSHLRQQQQQQHQGLRAKKERVRVCCILAESSLFISLFFFGSDFNQKVDFCHLDFLNGLKVKETFLLQLLFEFVEVCNYAVNNFSKFRIVE